MMSTMSDEKRRYYHPVTLLTEWALPAYAAQLGLVEWDGETAEIETEKVNLEVAVIATDLDDLKLPELRARAHDLGLDQEGTKSELVARIEQHAADAAKLHGDPAVGEQSETNSPKEG